MQGIAIVGIGFLSWVRPHPTHHRYKHLFSITISLQRDTIQNTCETAALWPETKQLADLLGYRDGRRKREENGEVKIPRKFALPNHSVVKDA